MSNNLLEVVNMLEEEEKTALLSQEGSVIAKRSREGWFQSRQFSKLLLWNHPS